MKARTTKKKTRKSRAKTAQTRSAATPKIDAKNETASVETASVAVVEVPRSEVQEAARILKSGGSKKRERRRAASVMSQFGSRKGGLNRARNLSPAKLKEIATLGGLARQAKARERAAALSQTDSPNTQLLQDAAR